MALASLLVNRLIRRLAFAVVLMFGAVSCTSLAQSDYSPLNRSANYYDYIQPSFDQYLTETKRWLTLNRAYITAEREKEISMNMPFELVPSEPTDKAILLVHGLGDSPFSFSDLAPAFQQQGFHVQVLLLPGHGSKPQDLKLPNYNDWQTIVDHYSNLLKKDYDEVWLGGFSTGGNLVTIHTIEQGGVDGLVLISPGLQSKIPFLEKFAPLASVFIDGWEAEENNLARYNSAPLNGAIAYSESAEIVRDLLDTHTVNVPTMMLLTEADSVVDPVAVKDMFEQSFENPKNTLIWYGESVTPSELIKVRKMRLAEHKISTGSHMSPLFAPSNAYYGEHGEKRMCMNSMDEEEYARCKKGEEVWLSAWGYEEEGKIHARLTWNPYFNELGETIRLITH